MAVEPTTQYLKPLPQATWDSAPFWEACRRHSLELQHCNSCGKFWFPPGNRCGHCLSDSWEWKQTSGKGSVITFVVMRRAYHPTFADDVPYNVAVIELAEGPRVVSNVVECELDNLKVGMPVSVVFDDVTPDATLPKFRPA